jgi:hypothetical protein
MFKNVADSPEAFYEELAAMGYLAGEAGRRVGLRLLSKAELAAREAQAVSA